MCCVLEGKIHIFATTQRVAPIKYVLQVEPFLIITRLHRKTRIILFFRPLFLITANTPATLYSTEHNLSEERDIAVCAVLLCIQRTWSCIRSLETWCARLHVILPGFLSTFV